MVGTTSTCSVFVCCRSYESGDIVRIVVLEVKRESQRLLGGMRTESLATDLQNIIKLGLVETTELPSTLAYAKQVRLFFNFPPF